MGEVQAASEKALEEGKKRGAKLDVNRDRQLLCPNATPKPKEPSSALNAVLNSQ